MIPAFITVRTASGRLPNKCLLPLGSMSVLEHVIKRCSHFGFRPLVCTTIEKTDDVTEHIGNAVSVEVFRGHPENVQQRWFNCAMNFDIKRFHTVDCDDPYFDPLEVKRSFDYLISNNLKCVLPTTSSALHGLGMMGTSWFMGDGDVARLPERGQEFQARLTLDYPEDYWMLRTLHHLHCDYSSSRKQIEECIAGNTISSLNGFRHVDWKTTQALESKSRELADAK